ncbi:MAG: hypothetical protein CR991_02490 [Proteobacteria bacterium]|nr:MAG: hypothetical protein CR991_02490 [Pseudomonadota bacterium]
MTRFAMLMLVFSMLLLSACGNKGALYLPDKQDTQLQKPEDKPVVLPVNRSQD